MQESDDLRAPLAHSWDLSVEDAITLQQRLRPLVSRGSRTALDSVRTVAGVDVSYTDVGRAAVVVFSYPELEVVDRATATRATTFPYVPGLLSFREAPVALEALARLRERPDVLICDGQGYAHPRRLGLASHLGLYLDLPSIGCAKSRLVGVYDEPGPNVGDRAPLRDHGELVGTVLRSKRGVRPLFVSVGYRMDLETAVAIVLGCLRGYRLPEPTRLADRLAGELAAQARTAGAPPTVASGEE